MVVKLIVNLKHLQREMIDTFFINYQNNMIKRILLTFLSPTLHTIIKNGQETYYKMTAETSIWTLKNVKSHLVIILETIWWLLVMISITVGFLLMMVFCVVADNIHDCYAYLFKKERLSKPSLCLTTFCRLVKIGIKKLPKKLSGLKSHLRLPS